jgi:hypothetical protein
VPGLKCKQACALIAVQTDVYTTLIEVRTDMYSTLIEIQTVCNWTEVQTGMWLDCSAISQWQTDSFAQTIFTVFPTLVL